jgi:hypothetical protein
MASGGRVATFTLPETTHYPMIDSPLAFTCTLKAICLASRAAATLYARQAPELASLFILTELSLITRLGGIAAVERPHVFDQHWLGSVRTCDNDSDRVRPLYILARGGRNIFRSKGEATDAGT